MGIWSDTPAQAKVNAAWKDSFGRTALDECVNSANRSNSNTGGPYSNAVTNPELMEMLRKGMEKSKQVQEELFLKMLEEEEEREEQEKRKKEKKKKKKKKNKKSKKKNNKKNNKKGKSKTKNSRSSGKNKDDKKRKRKKSWKKSYRKRRKFYEEKAKKDAFESCIITILRE